MMRARVRSGAGETKPCVRWAGEIGELSRACAGQVRVAVLEDWLDEASAAGDDEALVRAVITPPLACLTRADVSLRCRLSSCAGRGGHGNDNNKN
eukprot:SAG25_NODE_601_length_6632_cov_6.861319_6_plen_95_part_00